MKKEWQTNFNLSEKDYTEWKNSDQQDSLAVWAIKDNKINLDQYMDWATQHYQIPFLTDSFFHNITINLQFWNRIKDREEWNNTFLPLYEWQDILFAGCIKPVEKTLDKNIVSILVSPKNLNMFWKKITELSQPAVSPVQQKSTINNPKTPAGQTKAGFFSKPASLFNTIINKTILTQIISVTTNEIFNQVFKLSEKYFTGVLIFSFHNNHFKPMEWSDSMSGSAIPIEIDQPSIFKMIVNSRSPYHGFIVDNEVHNEFFTRWGFSKLPKHITLIPLLNNSNDIIGAFMGIADEIVHQKHLYEITKWTKPLPTALQKAEKEKQQAG